MANKNFPRARDAIKEENWHLISAIQAHPCLWMERDKSYRNSMEKNDAWLTICSELGKSQEVLKKRWRNLTIQYFANRKTYQASHATGPAASEVQQKDLWYAYEAMGFLEQVNRARRTVHTDTHDTEQRAEVEVVVEEVEDDEFEQPPPQSTPCTSNSNGTPGPSKRKRTHQDARVLDSLESLEASIGNIASIVNNRNSYEGIGQFVADTLAKNDEENITNAELASKIFELCALTKKNPQSEAIKQISKKLRQCDRVKFELVKNKIDEFLEEC